MATEIPQKKMKKKKKKSGGTLPRFNTILFERCQTRRDVPPEWKKKKKAKRGRRRKKVRREAEEMKLSVPVFCASRRKGGRRR